MCIISVKESEATGLHKEKKHTHPFFSPIEAGNSVFPFPLEGSVLQTYIALFSYP